MTGLYRRSLALTLRHRPTFVAVLLLLLGGSFYLFSTIERAFASQPLEREVIIRIDIPRQYSLEQTAAVYDELYGIFDGQRDDLDIVDIAYSYDRSTGRSRAGWRRTRQMSLFLADEERSVLTTASVQDRVRELLPVIPGVGLNLASGQGRYSSSGIEVELMGDDLVVLELLSKELTARLAALPMVRDVDTSLESGDEEIHVEPGRERILQAGLSTQAVAATVSSSLSSRAVTQFRTDEREVDLVMQYEEAERETLDQLKNVPLFTGEAAVPLGALADFRIVAGPRTILRENHRAKVTVSANATSAGATFGAMRAVNAIMDELPLPAGYEWSYGRWNRFQQQDQQSGLFALLFALPLVYMLLAALFESFAQPFTIMFSVPFAALGVAVVMKVFHQPWETMTLIGMVVLVGIVVNNAIVLLDQINRLRRAGMSRDEAILLGGEHRLRPILITAITTILGLMPMVAPFLFPQWFGAVEGRAATWAPIGLVIVGGLTTSTFLTLMIIPTIYSLVDDFTGFVRRVARTM